MPLDPRVLKGYKYKAQYISPIDRVRSNSIKEGAPYVYKVVAVLKHIQIISHVF